MLAMAGVQDTTEPEVAGLLRSAHLQLADEAERDGDLGGALAHVQSAMAIEQGEGAPLEGRELALRKNLGLYWYQKGSSPITTDLGQAIAALQKSVTYNPSDNNARRKLLQAQTMQRNLRNREQALGVSCGISCGVCRFVGVDEGGLAHGIIFLPVT
jgi:hypothetical protein